MADGDVAEERQMPHLSLVIPAYNEARRIGYTLEQTRAYLDQQSYTWEIIVVDDGSTDNTVEIVEAVLNEAITLMQVTPNRGKGYALKVGMLKARGQYVGFMDADYKTDISCTQDALDQLSAGADIAIGSRKTSETQIQIKPRLYRRLGSLFFNKYIHFLLPILRHYKDTQCGFKFFTKLASRKIFSRSIIERFMFDAEVLLLAHKFNFVVKEIPVRWSSDFDSHTRIIESVVHNSKDLIRIRVAHKDL